MIVSEFVAKLGFEFDGRGFDKMQEAIEKVKTNLEEGHAQLALFAGAAALGAAKSILTALTIGAAKHAKEVETQAMALGVSADAFERYSRVAEMTGASSEQFSTGLAFLEQNINEARNGSEEAQKSFAQLGVSFAKGVPIEKILANVTNKISKLGDAAQRVDVTKKLFGRGGVALLPMLQKGEEGIERHVKLAREWAALLDEQTNKRLIEVAKNVGGVHMRLEGLKNTLVKAFLPSVEKTFKGVMKWLDANRAVLQSIAGHAARSVIHIMDAIATSAMRVADMFLTVAKNVDTVMPGLSKLILAGVALAAVFLSPALAIAAFIALVYLWLDDLGAFIKGERSLIGQMRDDWRKLSKELEDVTFADWSNSPLLVALKFMVETINGAVEGIKLLNKMLFQGGIGEAIAAARERSQEEFRGVVAAANAPAPNMSMNQQITINAAPGQSPQEIAQSVMEHTQSTIEDAYSQSVPRTFSSANGE